MEKWEMSMSIIKLSEVKLWTRKTPFKSTSAINNCDVEQEVHATKITGHAKFPTKTKAMLISSFYKLEGV
jgi:hypothetical protein